ncbi:MAG: hypothetical protein ACLFN8_05200 [Candidatus Woesearchaeota archaeon]
MNLMNGNCRENLVDKYNVIGLVGDGILPIEVGRGCALSAYVVGDVLKAMCRSPSLKLYDEEPTEAGLVLKLTSKGVSYLKNNINAMVAEYKSVIAEEDLVDCDKNDLLTDAVSDIYLMSEAQRTNISLDNLASSADIIQKNGVAIVVSGDSKNKLLNQNTYGSTSHNLAEDVMYLGSVDESIVGSRNLINRSGIKNMEFDF